MSDGSGAPELAWETRGDGPPLVLLHGLAIDRRVLAAACEPVLDGRPFRRIYVDLPGHGGSPSAARLASADALVDALAPLVRELAGAAPLLLGYSYGGYLAQGLTARLGDVRGLCLVCPTVEPDFGRRTVPPKRVAARDPELAFTDERERAEFEEIAVVQTRALLERFQQVVHPANRAADHAFLAEVRARYTMARPYAQALAALTGPASLICARDDHWVGWQDAARLARTLRSAELHVLPDCGHLLPFEQPARFATALASWLDRL